MKVNQKYVEIGLILFIIIIGVCAYRFGYMPYAEKAEALQSEIDTQNTREKTLTEKETHRKEWTEFIAEAKDKIDEMLKKYGGGVLFENATMIANEIENSTGVFVDSISLSDYELVYYSPTEGVIVESTMQQADRIAATESCNTRVLKRTMNVSMSTGYTAFKKVAEFLNNYPERMVLDNFTLGYDPNTGELTNDMTVNMYMVLDENHEYKAPEIKDEDVTIGNPNLFRSFIPEPTLEEALENIPEGEFYIP